MKYTLDEIYFALFYRKFPYPYFLSLSFKKNCHYICNFHQFFLLCEFVFTASCSHFMVAISSSNLMIMLLIISQGFLLSGQFLFPPNCLSMFVNFGLYLPQYSMLLTIPLLKQLSCSLSSITTLIISSYLFLTSHSTFLIPTMTSVFITCICMAVFIQ